MYKYCTTVHTVLSVLRTVQLRPKFELAFVFFAARRNAFQWFKLEECYCSGRPLSAVSFRVDLHVDVMYSTVLGRSILH